jgi:hypothetical protein
MQMAARRDRARKAEAKANPFDLNALVFGTGHCADEYRANGGARGARQMRD